MVLMGTRTGPNSENKHINYATGKDMRGVREHVRTTPRSEP